MHLGANDSLSSLFVGPSLPIISGATVVVLGLVCVLPFICLLFSNHTNLKYVNGWGLYGEFRYKCNPTRWPRITRQQV